MQGWSGAWLDELLPLEELRLELDVEQLDDESPLGADGNELESPSLTPKSLVDEWLSDDDPDQLGSLDAEGSGSLEFDSEKLLDEEVSDSLDDKLWLLLELDCEFEENESELETELPERLDEPDDPDSDDELCDEPELEAESLLEELLGSELEDDELEEELLDELDDDELVDELEEELEDDELDEKLELELSLVELSDEALSDDSELSLLDGAEELLDDDDELLEDEPEDGLDEELLSHGSQHSSRSHGPRSIRVAL